MFKIYDLNMKEIPFPDGVMPLEIFVGSIGKDRVTEAVDGRPGVVDYGFNYTDRPVSLFLRIKAKDKIDFRLLRNEVFATFDVGNSFYVAESDVPSRVLKVVVDESYIPDRLTEEYADFDINCRTLDSVFWESKYTTLELHDSGYSATAEKYGLVDNIDDEKVRYRFEPSRATQSLVNESFKYGFLSSSTGGENTSKSNIITSDYVRVYPGIEYEFEDTGTHPTLNYWWIYEYDDSNNFIKSTATNKGDNRRKHIFITEGSKLRFMAQSNSGESIDLAGVGDDILPRLRRDAMNNSFNVYNAGNVTVEPEYMDLTILVLRANFSESLTIRNVTTSEEFTYYGNVSSQSILLDGVNVLRSSAWNSFRNTNRRFIRLAPGDNLIEVTGGTFDEISFKFKYLYK